MNRTPAQAAKVLGIDTVTLKRWAWLFSEYLSSGANPQKGKTREFSDSDILVLCYVGYEWEDPPDLEAIKTGLNYRNHYEEPFREHLYLHTPLLQEPPDDLDETWRHGILLCGGGRFEYLELARNYREVAESMLRQALEKDSAIEWAYPVLFAYRHTLELYLKLIGEIDEATHSLQRCVHLVEEQHRVKLPAPLRGWILELEQIDPAGTAFRYIDGKFGQNPSIEQWFDFQHFRFAMKRVFDALDMAILRAKIIGPRSRDEPEAKQ